MIFLSVHIIQGVSRTVSVAIVEDEKQTANQLTTYLNRYGTEKSVKFLIRHYPQAELLLSEALPNTDLILMDINLGGIDGMAAAKELRYMGYDTPLIFITSLSQYAVHGYDVDALDFIVKPVSYFQFSMKLDKACRVLRRKSGVRISISVDRSPYVFSSNELYYVETIRHDLLFHTTREAYRTRGTISSVEQRLDGANFLRINTCYLINLDHLTGLSSDSVTMANGDELSISRARRKNAQAAIVQYLGGCI